MSIASEISRLQNAKADIKTSIEAKGVTVPNNETLDNYSGYIDNISGGSSATLQTKSVTITQNGTTTVEPDTGYDGLESVSVVTNVPTSGDVPNVGVIFSNWDTNGYPHNAEVVGKNIIDDYYFAPPNSGNSGIVSKLETITLPNTVTQINQYAFNLQKNLTNINLQNTQLTTIGNYAFSGCAKLNISALPNTLISIGNNGFVNCYALELTSIPDSVTTIGENCFASCSKIKIKTLPNVENLGITVFRSCSSLRQMSMPKIKTITSNQWSSPFYGTSSIYGIWIGNSLTSIGRYSLIGIGQNYLKRIYIDLPRSTVETLSGYEYAFKNNANEVSKIVCNDDDGFITQEQFDAIDWENYTE